MKDDRGYPQDEHATSIDFDVFFAREHGSVERYVRMRVRDDADAEDIIAESACQLIEYCRRTDRIITHHRALFFKIAKTRIADYYAARASGRNALPLEEADALPMPQSLVRTLEVDEELRNVFNALRELRGEDREMITLHAISGLSIDELAEFFDARPGAIRVRLFRARRALRRAMQVQQIRKISVAAPLREDDVVSG